jgi:hypothetical protein
LIEQLSVKLNEAVRLSLKLRKKKKKLVRLVPMARVLSPQVE